MPKPSAPTTLVDGAVKVLNAASPDDKVSLTADLASKWRAGGMIIGDILPLDLSERPARPEHPVLLPPQDMPKRGTGGKKGRRALLHALAHIELNAIDLAWDLIARFSAELAKAHPAETVSEFCDDWIRVADDEARHFKMLQKRLAVLDTHYGDLPAHDGLWAVAMATQNNILARLAVVPMVLEARGLDVTPATCARLREQGLNEDADDLDIIYRDEIVHVATGVKWFNTIALSKHLTPAEAWRKLVKEYFKGRVRGPFNTEGRNQANFSPDFYENLDE